MKNSSGEEMTEFYKQIAEKRKILRNLYGGLMTLEQVKQELGYKSRDAARNAIRELGVPGVRIGKSIRYDTDVLARRLVELRDMY